MHNNGTCIRKGMNTGMTRENECSLGGTDQTDRGHPKDGDEPRHFVISGICDKIKLPQHPKIVEIRCTLESFLLYTSCQRTRDDPARNPKYLFIFYGGTDVVRRLVARRDVLDGWLRPGEVADIFRRQILCTKGHGIDGTSGHAYSCGRR